jgi:HEAT repeat protein
VPQAEPTLQTRQLVSGLVKLEPQNGILTDDYAKRWKQNLQQLVQQGSTGIPAIQEFLRQNLDYAFGDTGRQLLGYSSARGAMIDALAQIGGAQAVSAMTGVLQTTGDPREIALLAQSLEKLDPGQHQQEVVNAAEQALALAREPKSPTMDVAPLFEVLQKYGGANVAGELQNAAQQWNYYAPISLAQLPDGAGIPSLLQMAQDPKVTGTMRDATLFSLAQVFDQSPEARTALLEQARANGISQFALVIMAPVLAGDRVQFLDSASDGWQGLPEVAGIRSTGTSNNQRFYSIPVEVSPAQGSQRLAFIDQMLAATSDPASRETLQQSRSQLASRLSAAGSNH